MEYIYIYMHFCSLKIVHFADDVSLLMKSDHLVWLLYLNSFVIKGFLSLTHWGRVTHICVINLTIIGSDNGLSPGRCQAIIWTNNGQLLIGPLEQTTNFSEILIEILTFSYKKMRLKSVVWKMAAILSRPHWVNWKIHPTIPKNGWYCIVHSGTCSDGIYKSVLSFAGYFCLTELLLD